MKLPFTEKFLWDLFNFILDIDKAFGDSIIGYPRTMNEALCPEFYKFRREMARKRDRKNFAQLISYLKRKGYIRVKELEGKEAVFITQKGAEKIFKIRIKMAEKKKRKDGRYIMVIYDIPETKRRIREAFRNDLQLLGFQKFQRSIWISPCEVLKEVQDLIKNYAIEPHVRLLLVKEMEIQ